MNQVTTQDTTPMSVKDWAITVFIAGLPLIGIIMLLVWAFSDGTNIHKQNWAKGTLIVFVIGFILAFITIFIFGGMAALFGSMQN